MGSIDGSPDRRADVIAAAHAAASWARARRATWTDVPPAGLTTAPEARTPTVEIAPASAAPPSRRARWPAVVRDALSAATARAGEWTRAVWPPVTRWLPRIAVAVVLLAAAAAGGRYLLDRIATSREGVAVVEPVPIRPEVTARKATGDLRVNSTPAGAQVIVDGKVRGVTPLTLADVSVGRHSVELRSRAGTVQRSVTVAAGKTSDVDESIFSGWLAIYSPFDLVITESGRTLHADERNQIMLPPGRHEIRLENRALGFDVVRQVDVKPGEMATLSLKPPPSTLSVTATEPSEVWLDGARVGETPVNAWPVDLGTHELVLQRATGGERRCTITVTVSPVRLNVDFSNPGPC